MRAALTICASAIAHAALVLWGLVWFASPSPLEAVPAASIAVDIVSPNEIAEPPKAEPPQPQPQAEPVAQPTPDPPAIEPAGGVALFHWPVLTNDPESPVAGFEAPADSPANLSRDEIAAFKAHLQKCWKQAPGLTDAQRLKVVLRVSLKPDGALTTQPELIAASASPYGPALVESAMRALRQCQPYSFLPADRYKEWKVLDLSFSPRGMSGG